VAVYSRWAAAGKICQAAGVSLPPPLRPWENVVPTLGPNFSNPNPT